jgi:beta-glucosidase
MIRAAETAINRNKYFYRMKKIQVIAICIMGLVANAPAQQNTDRRIEDLLSKMTLEEKIGQMNQLSFGERNDLEPQIRSGKIGSLLNVTDVNEVNRLQRIAVEESRLGIPLIIGRDVIHGFKTIFPIPLGQAASFSADIVESGARVAAREARSMGIHWTFAPMLDISRDARWGRIAESLGEDPYLASRLGVAMVKGFQGADLADPGSIAACLKHFAGYGAAEGGRDYNSTNIPPRLMRNVYLRPFQAAVIEGKAATVMTSFNDNDGIPSSGNRFLLKDVLRDEWKFDGFVVSDWASMTEMLAHGVAGDRGDVASISANVGVDMEMVSGSYIQQLAALVAEGKVSQGTIDDAVRNILRIKFRLGLFERPYVQANGGTVLYAEEHLKAARQAAVESAILLKNEKDLLPLKKGLRIAVIGPLADAPHDQLGTWVFDGEKAHTVTPLNALQSEWKDVKYIYEPGLAHVRETDKSGFGKAEAAARQADVAVVFVGEEAIMSGEAHSFADINLYGVQSDLLEAVKRAGKPVVMVVMAGRPLTIERDLKNADAVLYNFHPGTMGGPAIWDLLFGAANPGGKLPVTFPRHVGQIPLYYNHNNTGRPAPNRFTSIQDIPLEAGQTSLGNTSHYLDYGARPLFPFGYGLSYSRFEYAGLSLSADTIRKGETVTVSARITNTSLVDGSELVQLYIRDRVGSIARPVKELKGFQKIYLKAGESKTVTFSLGDADLAFWGMDMKYKAEPGNFDVWIGENSDAGLKGGFMLID